MPNYQTLQPISVTLELGVGNVRIAASDRTDTIVEVRPSNEADESDVKAAELIRVDYTDGLLRITGPKTRVFDFSRKTKSVDVSIRLPGGSQLSAEMQAGDIRGAGRLGQCKLKTSTGSFWLERTGPLRLETSWGNVTVDGISGNAEICTGTGTIQIGEVAGTAVVKNSNGDTTIHAITGDVRVRAGNGHIDIGQAGAGVDAKTANGEIHIERAGAGVDARTSNGSIHLGEVARGLVVLGTAAGDLEIGVAKGTAAWLAVNTGFGHVHNLLENVARPEEADETVEVRGRTSYGDITIHRS